MAQAKYSAGQHVSVLRGPASRGFSQFHRVVAILPIESGGQKYRIRGEGEQFDRVIEEVRLEAKKHD